MATRNQKTAAVLVVIGMAMGSLCVYINPAFLRERGLPAAARGLPAEPGPGSAEFDRRIQEQFQAGMTEGQLLNTLSIEGYEIRREDKMALLQRRAVPCQYTWVVIWGTGAQDVVTNIKGTHGQICP
ncbi:MAG: hypothetical protein ACK5P7_07450 [Bdellovibrio sp.]|jgi:hypothetical protein